MDDSLIENAFNKFMVLYFKIGLTYEEALKRTEVQIREVLNERQNEENQK